MALPSSSSSSCSSSMADLEDEMPHVLAVDDSLVDRKLIERLLATSSCKVTTAENAQRALELLGLGEGHHAMNSSNKSKVNLIITDYCMPGMTGYDLLKKVKGSSDLKEIPVVVVSSENVPTRIKKCLEGGAQEFMIKPLKQSDVKKLRCHMTKLNRPCSGRLCIGREMDAPASLLNTHVKLLGFDLLTLVPNQVDQTSFSRNGVRLSRVEAAGVVVSREFKPGRFLKFIIDDSTGCIPCVLWLNQLSSPYFSRRSPPDVRAIAVMASRFASDAQLGRLARVRGKITGFRGAVQITVSDIVTENDPNSEILHWLDCVKLSRNCYEKKIVM